VPTLPSITSLRKRLGTSQLGRSLWTWWDRRQTEVYLLSYPKCGRTWLRLMIGKALVEANRLDMDPLEIGQFYRGAAHIPRMRVSHDDKPQLKRPEDVERDKSRYAGKRVIFLVRDPRDTMISYYFQASKRRGRFTGTASEFLRHPVGSLDTIIAYYNVWADNRAVPSDLCVVRYEDLHADPKQELRRALGVIGGVPSDDVIDRAVDFARFDNMRKLEIEGSIGRNNRLKPADANDPASFKTRKGEVGGYRNYLSAEDIEYMNARIKSQLSPFYASYLDPR